MKGFNEDLIDAIDMKLVEIIQIIMCNVMALFGYHKK